MSLVLGLLLAAQDWIAELDDDDVGVRERATQALQGLGLRVEGDLRSRLAEGISLEAASRIRRLLDGIARLRRVAAFPGGDEVAGLRCAVRLVGVPTLASWRIRFEILNSGSAPRDIALVSTWNQKIPGWSSSYGNAEAELRITGGPPTDRAWSVSQPTRGGHPRVERATLQPGESRTFEFGYSGEFLLPGRYRLSVAYLALRLLESREATVLSNTIDLELPP